MLKTRIRATLAVCAALLGLVAPSASAAVPPAAAAPPSELAKSAGQKFHLKHLYSGKYVTVSGTDSGVSEGALRALVDRPVTGEAGLPHTFSLHTSRRTGNDRYGEMVTLRSEQNGSYVTAEANYTEPQRGILRARSDGPIGEWERFTLKSQGGGVYTLKSLATEQYLSVPDHGNGLLRAVAPSVTGDREKFTLEPVKAGSLGPASGVPTRNSLDVMTWNVCTNNGTDRGCNGFYQNTPADFTKTFMEMVGVRNPDIILLQEFCEKYARPLEDALERGGTEKWDVRFAPIEYRVSGSENGNLRAQKPCVMDGKNADRGAYGVAIAVPAENTFYQAHPLTSPNKSNVEQRTALCASVPSWSVLACTTHFTPRAAGDDPDPRIAQASELRAEITEATAKGYRVIFGGDLNAKPDEMGAESFYGAGHQECDRNNRPTFDPTPDTPGDEKKLDYLFGPANTTWHLCSVTDDNKKPDEKLPAVSYSDHHALRGVISLR
ncbi:endonuclease/exonuclease/phosphatase family protein [Streptomyces qinzhouensis]|uniref:Endonuclease/exonuclease/phosphatase domain-containing protein n=1 Tax=Streptomyces qinzhouensis TaxID=2599401 RepID=A0A5B8JCX9_9ACTN|nr:endonuclease/exonuclease/phosphatase family protein [Streptomyces qinzhouensis]QDY79605.1 hypothetical protein FQU76_27180 [Streptomyces qinzhouensis]